MLKEISNLFEDFLILTTQCAFWLYALALGVVVMVGLVFPLAVQALEWLQDGFASPRDGFWIYALLNVAKDGAGPGW